jgi:chromate transporter
LYFSENRRCFVWQRFSPAGFDPDDVVNNYHWLTQRQLVDAITVDRSLPDRFPRQLPHRLPGSGIWGAVSATLGIFIPSFFIVFLTSKWLTSIKKGGIFTLLLQAITIGVIALILVVAVRIFQTAITDILTL